MSPTFFFIYSPKWTCANKFGILGEKGGIVDRKEIIQVKSTKNLQVRKNFRTFVRFLTKRARVRI